MTAPLSGKIRQEELRRRLQAQRLLFAQRTYPLEVHDRFYPRSVTMRLLMGHRGLGFLIVSELAPILLGYAFTALTDRRHYRRLKAEQEKNPAMR